MSSTYNTKQVSDIFGVAVATVWDWRIAGLLPHTQGKRAIHYDKEYVDYLSSVLNLVAAHGGSPIDRATMELCYLRYMHNQLSAVSQEPANEQLLEAINAKCAHMVADGRVATRKMLAEALKDHVAFKTIVEWSQKGLLATVRIGYWSYVSVNYLRRLVLLYTNNVTIETASQMLQMPKQSLLNLLRREYVSSIVYDVTRTMRIPLELVDDIRRSTAGFPEDALTFPEAAAVMGVSHAELKTATGKGRVKTVRIGGKSRIMRSEAEFWRKKFTALNPGFGWLQSQLELSPRRAKTLSTGQAARRLGIGNSTLNGWGLEDLIPCYTRAYNTIPERYYVELYVDGLVRFAGQTPVHRSVAREYKQRCAHAQIIL